MALKNKVTATESDRIVALLESEPLPRVRRLTGRSYDTLLRIAKARLQ